MKKSNAMFYLSYFIAILGLFEIISNIVHLSKGIKEQIGLSAKKQHQELSLEINIIHFYYKALIMFLFGLLFVIIGVFALMTGNYKIIVFAVVPFAIYGIIQALYYRRPFKIWLSALVYLAPCVVYLVLAN